MPIILNGVEFGYKGNREKSVLDREVTHLLLDTTQLLDKDKGIPMDCRDAKNIPGPTKHRERC